MEPGEREQSPPFLLYQLLGVLAEYSRGWGRRLRHEPALVAFLVVSFVSFNAMVVLNLQRHPFIPWRALPVLLPIVWLFFFGGIFLAMVFVAQTSDRPTTPSVRRPRLELTALLAYLLCLFAAIFLKSHGYTESLPAVVLSRVNGALDHLDRFALQALGIRESVRAVLVLRNFHFFLVFPFAALVLSGNRLSDLGFRLPAAKGWTLWVWAALPVANFVLLPLDWKNAWLALAAALFGPGLAEEFTFRVALQTRLEGALGRPLYAMMLSALLFAGIHLAHRHPEPLWAVVNALGPKLVVGFLLSYLWYRTRSLVPLILLHGTLDVAFLAGPGG